MPQPTQHAARDRCDPDDTGPPPHLDQAVGALQRHALAALLNNAGQPRLSEVAETASRDATGIAQAIAWLDSHGRLERDGDHLVGAHGLTTRPTQHALVLGERRLHTWCAYDAMAIPVALGATARAETTCPACGRPLVVRIDAGVLVTGSTSTLWMPTGPCHHVIDDFCANANLFCNPDHLDTWRTTAGDPPGFAVALEDVPDRARADWADVASP
jgi:alkylmercury lyase